MSCGDDRDPSVPSPVQGQTPHDDHIAVAAQRFGLAEALIERAIAVESAGDPRAVSRAGAMGLMQLMPTTWAQLRAELSLGDDPFSPRDNILAGAAYLRRLAIAMAPRYLAACNAGPGRYEQSLAGRPLPLETRLYVEWLGGAGAQISPPDWRRAGLFPAPWSIALGVPDGVVQGSPWAA